MFSDNTLSCQRSVSAGVEVRLLDTYAGFSDGLGETRLRSKRPELLAAKQERISRVLSLLSLFNSN